MTTNHSFTKAFGVLAAGVSMLIAAQPSTAAVLNWNAADNGTIKPAGPRTGASGKSFFNVEGNNNGVNASWGVIDFNVADLGLSGTVGSIGSFSLTLTEANAAFSAPGGVGFWLASDTASSIQPGTSTLIYDATILPGGIGSQLGTLVSLGTGTFNTTGNVNSGQADVFDFTLSAEAETMILNTLNGGTGTLRLVVTPTDGSVAATWAGFSNSTNPGPKLTVEAVPEPASLAVLLLGGATLVGRRRRK